MRLVRRLLFQYVALPHEFPHAVHHGVTFTFLFLHHPQLSPSYHPLVFMQSPFRHVERTFSSRVWNVLQWLHATTLHGGIFSSSSVSPFTRSLVPPCPRQSLQPPFPDLSSLGTSNTIVFAFPKDASNVAPCFHPGTDERIVSLAASAQARQRLRRPRNLDEMIGHNVGQHQLNKLEHQYGCKLMTSIRLTIPMLRDEAC